MATPDGDFWSSIGPYLMSGVGVLVLGAYADLKRDNRWFRTKITAILIALAEHGIKVEDDKG